MKSQFHIAVNILRLLYKDHTVNAASRNNGSVLWQSYKIYTETLSGRNKVFFMVTTGHTRTVCIVSTVPWRLNLWKLSESRSFSRHSRHNDISFRVLAVQVWSIFHAPICSYHEALDGSLICCQDPSPVRPGESYTTQWREGAARRRKWRAKYRGKCIRNKGGKERWIRWWREKVRG